LANNKKINQKKNKLAKGFIKISTIDAGIQFTIDCCVPATLQEIILKCLKKPAGCQGFPKETGKPVAIASCRGTNG
jgi:hypothetical protein